MSPELKSFHLVAIFFLKKLGFVVRSYSTTIIIINLEFKFQSS